MPWHLERAINKIKNDILLLGAEVEKQLNQSVQSFVDLDAKMAQVVVDADDTIDDMEVDVEEECLKVLALHQPVAVDLRFIVAVLKINNDLERIGDLAAKVSKRSMQIHSHVDNEEKAIITEMGRYSQKMLKMSLDALVERDENLAKEVLIMDDHMDELNRQVYIKAMKNISDDSEDHEGVIQTMAVSRSLERVADLATNIAEDVLYFIQGKIIRHQTHDLK